MVRRRSLFYNLAYLATVLILVFAAWFGARAWFEAWRIDVEASWSSFDIDRWNNVVPPGSGITGKLLVAEADDEQKALLFLICADAKVRLLSKTVIDIGNTFKPAEGTIQMVDAKLHSIGRPEVRLPGSAWYFVKGLDMILTPELPDDADRFLKDLSEEGSEGQFGMHHSETAIYVHPAASVDAVVAFQDHCQQGETSR